MRTTTKGFTVWDLDTDPFDHDQLAANWDLLNGLLDASPKNVQLITNFTAGSAGGPKTPLAAGDLAVNTSTIQSFPAFTLLKYDGANWRAVAGVEVMAAVPTQNNFVGRLVLLTASSGGFVTGDMIRNTDGANAWTLMSPFAAIVSGGISGHQATGDIYFSTATRGPILVDRVTATKYRLYFSNGGLYSEIVT